MTAPIYAGTRIEVDGREACVTSCRSWGITGPQPGSVLGPGAQVSAVDEQGPVLALLTTDGWTEETV